MHNKLDWVLVEELFTRALEMDPQTWANFVQSQSDDEGVQKEVLDLLHQFQANPEFLESSPTPLQSDLPTTRIGPYEVIRPLGTGGMGHVYLAQKVGSVSGPVAIKVVREGLNHPEILQRFKAEQHILAQLDHPFICRLIETGQTESGLPYLVMEHIDGVPLQEYLPTVQDVPSKLRFFWISVKRSSLPTRT